MMFLAFLGAFPKPSRDMRRETLHPRFEAGKRAPRGPLAKWALTNPMLDPNADDPDGEDDRDDFLEEGLNKYEDTFGPSTELPKRIPPERPNHGQAAGTGFFGQMLAQ